MSWDLNQTQNLNRKSSFLGLIASNLHKK